MEVFDKKYAIYMINNGSLDLFLENINKFKELDLDIVTKLFEKKAGNLVISNLKKFKNIDIKFILKKALDNELYDELAENIFEFDTNYYNSLAEIIFENSPKSILNFIDNFPNLEHKFLVSRFLELEEYDFLLQNREKLDIEDDFDIIKYCIENGKYQSIAENIFKFKNIDEDSLVEKFYLDGEKNTFLKYKENFRNLTKNFE